MLLSFNLKNKLVLKYLKENQSKTTFNLRTGRATRMENHSAPMLTWQLMATESTFYLVCRVRGAANRFFMKAYFEGFPECDPQLKIRLT